MHIARTRPALNVLPANGNEVADATTLIQQEEQAHGNDVQGLSIDGIGFRGEHLREWTDPEGLHLEVFVPPRKEPAATGFTVDQFTLDPTGQTMTCPAGQTSQRRIRNTHNTGWQFRFARKVCAACPLLGRCMAQLPATPPAIPGAASAGAAAGRLRQRQRFSIKCQDRNAVGTASATEIRNTSHHGAVPPLK